jgi:AraC family transcriptional regulator
LRYIDAHLDEPIHLAKLAKVANFSAFHFHRIFAAHLGETLGNYLTRRRVEQAAARLASQPRIGVLTVASAVGFGSSEAFARAFKKHFGRTPTEWKKAPPLQWYKESKISQDDRRLSQEKRPRKRYVASMTQTKILPLQVAIKTRPPVRVAYLRYQGPFGAPLGKFWRREVYPWLAANNLLGAPKYGISHDDPQVTEKSKCRYDAGAEVGPDFVPPQNSQIETLAGGLYACTKFEGTSEELPAATNLMRDPASNIIPSTESMTRKRAPSRVNYASRLLGFERDGDNRRKNSE